MSNQNSNNTLTGELPIQVPTTNQTSNYMYNEQTPSQAQMRREDCVNQPSDIHSQGQATSFLQETGTQAKSVAQSAVNLARGAVAGATNMAHGAADVVKSTLGISASDPATTTNAMNHTGTTTTAGGPTNSVPSTTVDLGDPIYPSTTK